MTLNLPLDFERLPEFWQLKETLRTAWLERAAHSPPSPLELADAEIEDMAALLWIRLWIVLGYLATSTNRAGWLNAAGERQLNHSFRKFGEDCPPVSILTAGTVLRKIEDGYLCDMFAKVNPQLAGNYLTKEERGNRRSTPGRIKNAVGQEAIHQATLLPKDFFHKRDGALMNPTEVDRSMIVIISIDRAVRPKGTQRYQSTYTPGLMADACHVYETTGAEDLAEFFKWLWEVHDHPATPKSAEEVLRDFDRLLKASKA
jgi:hypothetical protein